MNSNRVVEISVIIPVFNAGANLRQTLEAFYHQVGFKESFELIFVDDCSTDNSVAIIEGFLDRGNLILIKNPVNSGAAAFTRNRGLDVAQGRIIIFSDGDIVPAPHFLKAHYEFHTTFPGEEYAALGNVLDPPDVKLTPLMRLGNPVGNWESKKYQHHGLCRWIDLRTGNFSLKRNFLGDDRFDQKVFLKMGFEDTQLGYRLYIRRMKILFNENAVSWHYHFREPREYIRKVVSYGEALACWVKSAPELADELNTEYNCIVDDRRLLSSANLKEFLRRSCINELTFPVVLAVARSFETIDQRISVFFYSKMYKFLFYKGYQNQMAKN